jgi:hypothetical protein
MNPAACNHFPSCIRSLVVLLSLAAIALGQSRPQVSQPVRQDWHLRESLVAIDDWETILSRWESQTAEHDQTPIFPVPASGVAVTWPNPVPGSLLPERDGPARVRLRIAGGAIALERFGRDGKENRQSVREQEVVRGYHHPGGGGSSRWYHRYHRRFDAMTAFRPRVAPFAIEVATPADFQLGLNELALHLRNVSDEPLGLAVRLRLLHRAVPHEDEPILTEGTRRSARGEVNERQLGGKSIELPGRGEDFVRFTFELSAPGGGVLLVSMEAAGQSYWFPLLTHVEDVPAVLASIERILSDTPDVAAATQLSELRRQTGELRRAAAQPADESWRRLFEQASTLRDQLLLRRIDFDRLLFVKRKPFDSEQPFMDAHHCYNPPGGAIYQLSPVQPDGQLTPLVESLSERSVHDRLRRAGTVPQRRQRQTLGLSG